MGEREFMSSDSRGTRIAWPMEQGYNHVDLASFLDSVLESEGLMKQVGILACFLLIAAVLVISAQDKPPVIEFDSLSKDFGKVTEGQVLRHVFRFTNKGAATLEILKVEPS